MKGVFVCLSDRAAAVAADGTKNTREVTYQLVEGSKPRVLSFAAGERGGSASSPLRRNGFGGFLGFWRGK